MVCTRREASAAGAARIFRNVKPFAYVADRPAIFVPGGSAFLIEASGPSRAISLLSVV